MPEVSIRDQLKKLVDVQKIDVEIYAFLRELKEKPLRIEVLQKEFEEKKSHLKELEEKSKTLQVQQKGLEGDLLAKEQEIVKANAQLSALKTNKEYQAKTTEIERIKADKSIFEEKILLSYDQIDAIKAEVLKETGVVKGEEIKFLSQKKEIDDDIKELQDKVKVLEHQRGLLVPEIDKTHLARYDKILKNKEGLAIVPVKGNSCGGCYMNVPAQVVNEIKMHDRVIQCEICSRLLYLEDDL